MSINAIPSKDPANDGDLAGALGWLFRKQIMRVNGQLPALVLSYDRDSNIANVQPLIVMRTTDGDLVRRAPIARVPVLALGGGGFVINFPLKAGDLGWIEASDRDISIFIQNLDESPPNTNRAHSFEDGRFIPDVMRQYLIANEDADAMVIQSVDATVRVVIADGEIRITAPAAKIKVPSTTWEGDINLTGNITQTGNHDVTGEVTANSIPLSTHRHGGVQTGGGTSGGPIA